MKKNNNISLPHHIGWMRWDTSPDENMVCGAHTNEHVIIISNNDNNASTMIQSIIEQIMKAKEDPTKKGE